MSSSLLSLRSRLTANQTAALSTMPAKRLHIQAFKDYESVPSADTVSPKENFALYIGIHVLRGEEKEVT
jgi:hypothetical protein